MYKLVLIRHGESTWNLENRFTGWTDVDLTPTGVEQARNAGRAGDDSTAGLFVAEPGVNLEFNLTSTLELGLGAGYRFVNGSDLDRLSDDDFSGWTATLFLRWTES